MTQEWKDKYIHSFNPLSGVWRGSLWATFSLIALTQSKSIDPYQIRQVARGWGSVVWMMPFEQATKDQILVETLTRNYTAKDLYQLLLDANATTSAAIFKDIDPYRELQAPGVSLNCIYGYNTSTISTIQFLDGFDGNYTFKTSDGDQTSIEAELNCDVWKNQQTQPITSYRIPNMIHNQAVFNPTAIRILLKLLNL